MTHNWMGAAQVALVCGMTTYVAESEHIRLRSSAIRHGLMAFAIVFAGLMIL